MDDLLIINAKSQGRKVLEDGRAKKTRNECRGTNPDPSPSTHVLGLAMVALECSLALERIILGCGTRWRAWES